MVIRGASNRDKRRVPNRQLGQIGISGQISDFKPGGNKRLMGVSVTQEAEGMRPLKSTKG